MSGKTGKSRINVCFRLNGGIGTYLMQENFIQYFYEKFSDIVSITVYGAASQEVNDGLFKGQTFIDAYRLRQDYVPNLYDLAVDINWFPNVVHIDTKKVNAASEELSQVVGRWIAFKTSPQTSEYMRNDSMFDPNIYTYAIVNGKNRVNVMDIGGLLGIGPVFKLSLRVKEPGETLSLFGLENQKYITMQQGVNANSLSSRSPKQWPNEYYSGLCKLLKERFPDVILVQLGETGNNEKIDGVDKCLLGRTSFEDLKVLLKNAALHVDGECGMVHMRRALHAGPSVVLYGQTPARVYGHEEDINLTANLCGDGCGKLFSGWKRRCYIADEPLCMKAITPEYVAETIGTYLSGQYRFPEKEPTLREKMLADPRIRLDEEWVDSWLKLWTVFGYWLEKIKIRDLSASKLTPQAPDGYAPAPIIEMPAYQYLTGNKQSYLDYMALNDQYNPGHEHSLERFEKLLERFRNGFDEKYTIAVDGSNTILDGLHRVCWLAWKNGLDSEITVLKLYGDW